MRVIHLPYGIGISALARALRTQGVEAVSCSLRSHHYSYLADQILNFDRYSMEEGNKLRKEFFKQAIEKYDIFHFHFGETFFPDRKDLEILKEKGKKIIVHHRGSEVRLLSEAKSFKNPYIRVKKSWPEEKVRSNLEFLSKYFDHAIVNDYELWSYVKPYYKNVYIVPHALDVNGFKPQYPVANQVPLILHAPSRRDTKGTEFVLKAIQKLKNKGLKFDFKLIEGLSHKDAIKLYKKATVIIDQLQIGAYGHLSIEAMALGKPVVCFIREDLISKYPKDLPIVSANPDTIFNVLKKLLRNPESWEKLGREGRCYVEKYHSYEKVSEKLLEIYEKI